MRFLKKLHSWCNAHEWIILLVGLVIIFRIPTLFTPHYYGDEEIYFVMGRAWRMGVPIYQAMFDHKPPLIYILAGIAQTVFWFRFMLMTAMVLHTILFYRVAQKLFGTVRPLMTYVSTTLFVILTTIPTFEGNIANAELFMMLPLTAALLIIFPFDSAQGLRPSFDSAQGLRPSFTHYSWYRYLVAGMVAGIGWLFKVPMAADFAALALFIFPISQPTFIKSLKSVFSLSFWAFVGGFVLPLLSTFIYYYAKGTGPAYLATVLTVNLGYVSSWSTSQFAFNPFKSGLLTRAMVVASFTLFVYLFRKKIDRRLQLVLLWLAFSFFGALLSGRPYPHYLQEPFVPLSLAIPYLFMTETLAGWIAIGALAIWAIVTNASVHFWAYDTWPLYTNFVKVATRQISQRDYYYTFDGARRNYLIADYLGARMNPQDKIFIWGSDTAIYNITNTLPAGGKYMVDFHIHDFHAEDYVIHELNTNKPRFIVVLPNSQDFPALQHELEVQYVPVFTSDGAVVYMRLAVYAHK